MYKKIMALAICFVSLFSTIPIPAQAASADYSGVTFANTFSGFDTDQSELEYWLYSDPEMIATIQTSASALGIASVNPKRCFLSGVKVSTSTSYAIAATNFTCPSCGYVVCAKGSGNYHTGKIYKPVSTTDSGYVKFGCYFSGTAPYRYTMIESISTLDLLPSISYGETTNRRSDSRYRICSEYTESKTTYCPQGNEGNSCWNAVVGGSIIRYSFSDQYEVPMIGINESLGYKSSLSSNTIKSYIFENCKFTKNYTWFKSYLDNIAAGSNCAVVFRNCTFSGGFQIGNLKNIYFENCSGTITNTANGNLVANTLNANGSGKKTALIFSNMFKVTTFDSSLGSIFQNAHMKVNLDSCPSQASIPQIDMRNNPNTELCWTTTSQKDPLFTPNANYTLTLRRWNALTLSSFKGTLKLTAPLDKTALIGAALTNSSIARATNFTMKNSTATASTLYTDGTSMIQSGTLSNCTIYAYANTTMQDITCTDLKLQLPADTSIFALKNVTSQNQCRVTASSTSSAEVVVDGGTLSWIITPILNF